MLKIDRKSFEYHNEIFALMNSTIRHDVQATIGSHFDPYQQPANLLKKKKIALNLKYLVFNLEFEI